MTKLEELKVASEAADARAEAALAATEAVAIGGLIAEADAAYAAYRAELEKSEENSND